MMAEPPATSMPWSSTPSMAAPAITTPWAPGQDPPPKTGAPRGPRAGERREPTASLRRSRQDPLYEVPLEGEEHHQRQGHLDERSGGDDVDVRAELPGLLLDEH